MATAGEIMARGTPAEICTAIEHLALRIISQAAPLSGNVPYDIPGFDVHDTRPERTVVHLFRSDLKVTAWVHIYARPGGAVLWLDCPQGRIEVFQERWHTILAELQRLDFIDESAARDQAARDDAPDVKRRGASRLSERLLSDSDREIAKKYFSRVQSRRGKFPAKQSIAEGLGKGDYRTIERWLETWPELKMEALDDQKRSHRK